jgi:hypothetical protein
MAINFETTTPKNLLALFKKAIDEKHVVTWSYDKYDNFTHTPDQWKGKAVMRPTIFEGKWLVMNFYAKEGKASKALYGVYHGRFIESMLTHCDQSFTGATATALPTNADRVAA